MLSSGLLCLLSAISDGDDGDGDDGGFGDDFDNNCCFWVVVNGDCVVEETFEEVKVCGEILLLLVVILRFNGWLGEDLSGEEGTNS